jgi:hypothetical protein
LKDLPSTGEDFLAHDCGVDPLRHFAGP